MANLSALEIPLPLVSQYLPEQFARVREGRLAATPHELAVDKVRDVLRGYALATGGADRESPAEQTEETSAGEAVHV